MMLDDELPRLYIAYPKCGHCHNDVTIEGTWAHCETCLVVWHDISEDATAVPDNYVEGSNVPCKIERPERRQEYDHNGKHVTLDYQPCILPSGHDGEHLWPHGYVTTPIAPTPTKEHTPA